MALALDGPISLIFLSVCRDLLLRVRTASPILLLLCCLCASLVPVGFSVSDPVRSLHRSSENPVIFMGDFCVY